MSFALKTLYKITKRDVVYTTLPLYHTAGGVIGIGQMVLSGATVVLRNKFSASNFWADCVKYKCTVSVVVKSLGLSD